MNIEDYGEMYEVVSCRKQQRMGESIYSTKKESFQTIETAIAYIEKEALTNIKLETSYDYILYCYLHGKIIGTTGILEAPYDRNAPLLSSALKILKIQTECIMNPKKIGPKIKAIYKFPDYKKRKYRLPHYDNVNWEKFNERRNIPKSSRRFISEIKEFFARRHL